uniref:Uncharacterized protein n=1 Tax=Knipowitschia caucasica TaxID=637954 RepID=A0AAV2MSI6_KNICA
MLFSRHISEKEPELKEAQQQFSLSCVSSSYVPVHFRHSSSSSLYVQPAAVALLKCDSETDIDDKVRLLLVLGFVHLPCASHKDEP